MWLMSRSSQAGLAHVGDSKFNDSDIWSPMCDCHFTAFHYSSPFLQHSRAVLSCILEVLSSPSPSALRCSGHEKPELKESATQVLSALKNISSIIAHYTQKINAWMSAHKGTPMTSDQVGCTAHEY